MLNLKKSEFVIYFLFNAGLFLSLQFFNKKLYGFIGFIDIYIKAKQKTRIQEFRYNLHRKSIKNLNSKYNSFFSLNISCA